MPTASKTETSTTTTTHSEPSPGDGEGPRASDRAAERVRSVSAETIEARTQKIGRELFERIGRGAKPWQRAWWEERFMAATLDDPLVRVQLFRFIDALPALKTTESVRRHLKEYLDEAGDRVPWWLGLGLRLAPAGSQRAEWLAAGGAGVGRRDGAEIHRGRHARRGHGETVMALREPPARVHGRLARRGRDQRGRSRRLPANLPGSSFAASTNRSIPPPETPVDRP